MDLEHCSYSFHTDGYDDTRKTGFSNFLIRLQTEGKATTTINDQTFVVEQGDIMFVPPECFYRLHIEDKQKSGDFHILINGEWFRNWWKNQKCPYKLSLSNTEQITTLWRYLSTESRRPTHEQNHELNDQLFRSIMLFIEQERHAQISTMRPFIVTRMMRYIEDNALERVTLEAVANEVALSVSRAAHLFKAHTNQTMIQYAQKIRLDAAINQMKYTNMTLEQIALTTGFGNYPYFHRVFKQVHRVPPGQYRKEL
ncbi:AraC family transcriptional regulator [Streptohalobacillus salinus]|uniref:AraC family transcriptional regulator n=1 Tax=Streptohalobacillus salinus TaxID=621096 RepID=A0A2V3W9N0_9BACI|nr:AraC family transcriptional regulator [Streptohalobacillus salinus]PXW91077.1 AraC family transcriptional regulator [Streptohalobacillus salinus]